MFFGRSFVVISSHFFRRWDDEIGGTWIGHTLTPSPSWRGRCYGKSESLVVILPGGDNICSDFRWFLMICPLLFGRNTSRYEFQLESQQKRETTTLYSKKMQTGRTFWTKSCYILPSGKRQRWKKDEGRKDVDVTLIGPTADQLGRWVAQQLGGCLFDLKIAMFSFTMCT